MRKNWLISLLFQLILGAFLSGCSGSPPSMCTTTNVAGNGSSDPCATGGSGGTTIPPKVISVSTGYEHTCALYSDGSAKCWGLNQDGEVGDGTRTKRLSPVTVTGLSNATKIIASPETLSCALINDGTVQCWGFDGFWPISYLRGAGENLLKPESVPGLSSVKDVALGQHHGCAVIHDGTVKCWGDCSKGQCGDGIVDPEHYQIDPRQTSQFTNAFAVSANDQHSCVLSKLEAPQCFGIVKDPTTSAVSYNPYPTVVPQDADQFLSYATKIASGEYWNSVVTDSKVLSWGNGLLGNGTIDASSVPVLATGISDAVAISAGYAHTCAVRQNGTVDCWGVRTSGQLGDGRMDDIATSPVQVSGISNAVDVSCGYYSTCAVTSDGGVYCWGSNNNGQLGNGTTVDSSTPVLVSGL